MGTTKTEKEKKKVPSLRLKKTRAEVINDAVIFGKWIASDNRFHYGKGRHAHHNGCYFCGTQPKAKKKAGIKKYKTTYCCNPFVGACFAHGGCVPSLLSKCRHGKSLDMGNGSNSYAKSPLYANLGKLPKKKLRKGDVLTGYGNGHVMLYIGNGKIVHAGHEDDNKVGSKSWKSSITVTSSFSYEKVYRFKGKVNRKMAIRHGEVSDRVAVLQRYLGITDDRIFGDDTKKAVKKWQKKHGLTADGVVGTMTVRKMKEMQK